MTNISPIRGWAQPHFFSFFLKSFLLDNKLPLSFSRVFYTPMTAHGFLAPPALKVISGSPFCLVHPSSINCVFLWSTMVYLYVHFFDALFCRSDPSWLLILDLSSNFMLGWWHCFSQLLLARSSPMTICALPFFFIIPLNPFLLSLSCSQFGLPLIAERSWSFLTSTPFFLEPFSHGVLDPITLQDSAKTIFLILSYLLSFFPSFVIFFSQPHLYERDCAPINRRILLS